MCTYNVMDLFIITLHSYMCNDTVHCGLSTRISIAAVDFATSFVDEWSSFNFLNLNKGEARGEIRGEVLGDGFRDVWGETFGDTLGDSFGDLDFLLFPFVFTLLESARSSVLPSLSFMTYGSGSVAVVVDTAAAALLTALVVDSNGLKLISR